MSIVIPARNEAARLPILLQSIQSQDVRPHEVIVVDDGSTDGTADVAQSLGARVIPADALPEGWRGKTWACMSGAKSSTGELLLFLDADTSFEAGGLRRVLSAYTGGALSVAPYHAVRAPYEQLSAFFNLVMTAGTGAFTLVPRQPDGLFGQMLLVDRASYDRVGGHSAVRGKILENLWLARELRRAGVPMQCRVGARALDIRMYPDGARDLARGWGKAFAGGARATAPAVLACIVLWLSGAVSATATLLWRPSVFTLATYLAFAIQIGLMLRRLGSFKLYTPLLFPIPLAFFFGMFAASALRGRRGVEWKGRVIHAD